jgi:hypothetical protein
MAAMASKCEQMRRSKWLAVITLVALTGVYLVSFFYKPAQGNYFTLCGFKNLTGLPCPGCGLTHSFCAIGKGDFKQALTYNLLGPPVFLASILIWLRAVLVILGRTKPVREFDQLAARLKPVQTFVIVFMLFGLARIAYLLIYQPATWRESPVSKLIIWLMS